MGRNIEIEFKNMVSLDHFNNLLDFFQLNQNNFTLQRNHYFETSDFSLKHEKAALRIREIDQQYELTLKKVHTIGILEINQPLSPKEAELMLKGSPLTNGEVYDELLSMNIRPENLHFYGTLTTERAEADFKKGRLMFDHSIYLGKEDFEIEYEVPQDYIHEGKKHFLELFHKLNIPFSKADNKIKRFFEQRTLVHSEELK